MYPKWLKRINSRTIWNITVWRLVLAKEINTYEFLNNSHSAYNRYYSDWLLNANSYFGGVEYRDGKYLKAYDIDYSNQ